MITYKEPVRDAPCKRACPLGMDVPNYVRLIAEGRFEDALAVIREKTPFASICGYLCFRPCEANCQRSELGGAVAIKALKRFAAEGRNIAKFQKPTAKPTGKSVAIIGSGPAGLTAAYHLARLGHAVTIYEALPEAGGMMSACIPSYRIPGEILDSEIDLVRQLGVKINTGTRVESIDSLWQDGVKAVFIAIGAHRSQKMEVAGQDSPGIIDCVNFLKDIRLGKKIDMGTRVAVIGGGNAAIDAARTALRLGAKDVTVLYRRSWNEMPANIFEVEEALSEGIKIQFMTVPAKIIADGGKLRIECLRLGLGVMDTTGRRRPEPIPGSEFTLEVDNVISAIGQVPDIPPRFGLVIGDNGTIQVAENLATSREGVFAGGDAVSGPATVTQAIAAGQKAAASIDAYLGGGGLAEEKLHSQAKDGDVPLKATHYQPGKRILTRPVKERIGDFHQIEQTLDAKNAMEEANRCLGCDLPIRVEPEKCAGCRTCQVRCSMLNLDESNPLKSYITVTRDHAVRTSSITFSDECKNCGQCIAVCNYGALNRSDRGL